MTFPGEHFTSLASCLWDLFVVHYIYLHLRVFLRTYTFYNTQFNSVELLFISVYSTQILSSLNVNRHFMVFIIVANVNFGTEKTLVILASQYLVALKTMYSIYLFNKYKGYIRNEALLLKFYVWLSRSTPMLAGHKPASVCYSLLLKCYINA